MNSPTTVTPADFRTCAGSFATGIAVVTTNHDTHGLCGIAINSFSTVSLEPPLVSFSLGRERFATQAFQDASDYSINILSEDQKDVSQLFARYDPERWSKLSYSLGKTGAPVIEGALSVFDCRPWTVYDGGDHLIFIGHVISVRRLRSARPLLYFSGDYKTLKDISIEEVRVGD